MWQPTQANSPEKYATSRSASSKARSSAIRSETRVCRKMCSIDCPSPRSVPSEIVATVRRGGLPRRSGSAHGPSLRTRDPAGLAANTRPCTATKASPVPQCRPWTRATVLPKVSSALVVRLERGQPSTRLTSPGAPPRGGINTSTRPVVPGYRSSPGSRPPPHTGRPTADRPTGSRPGVDDLRPRASAPKRPRDHQRKLSSRHMASP